MKIDDSSSSNNKEQEYSFRAINEGYCFHCSSDNSPQYQNGHGDPVPVPPGFVAQRDEQTEPVDFSTANEPVNFSGVRPVATFAGPVLAPGSGYSRESTPDSGGSHYMEAYRDPTGKHFLYDIYSRE